MPKVSVITPCYAAEAFIERTLDSVRAQTLTDWEHIVVDDGSPDAAAAVVERYAATEPRLSLLRQPNGGVENARNNGFRACSAGSRFLLFLDADDCLVPEMLETLTAYLEAHPDVGLVYCAVGMIDAGDNVVEENCGMTASMRFTPAPRFTPVPFGVRRLPDSEPETPLESLAAYFQAIPSVCLFRRTIYEQSGQWDESLRGGIIEDKDILLQCALLAPVHYLPLPLVRYRRHAGNTGQHGSDQNRLEKKWRREVLLPSDKARRVRRALDFNHFLSAVLQFRAAREALGRGRARDAWRFSLQGAKKYARFWLH